MYGGGGPFGVAYGMAVAEVLAAARARRSCGARSRWPGSWTPTPTCGRSGPPPNLRPMDVRRARTSDVQAVRQLVDTYSGDRRLLSKATVVLYEAYAVYKHDKEVGKRPELVKELEAGGLPPAGTPGSGAPGSGAAAAGR